MSTTYLDWDNDILGFPNSIFTHTLSLVLASAWLFAGIASCAPQLQSDSAPQLQSCRSTHPASRSPALATPGNLAYSGSSGSVLCTARLFSFSPVAQSLSAPSNHHTLSTNSPPPPKFTAPEHRFWDRENDLLFTAVAASRTVDYFSTLNFRRRGRDEVFLTNDIVDNHAAFASIEAGGTALSIAASYLFHHYHHHRLERWTSIIHAGLATSGAARNYCLKTAHP